MSRQGNDPSLITIVAKSATGKIIDIHVAEIISIDGQPLNPAVQDVRLAAIEERLERLEAVVSQINTD